MRDLSTLWIDKDQYSKEVSFLKEKNIKDKSFDEKTLQPEKQPKHTSEGSYLSKSFFETIQEYEEEIRAFNAEHLIHKLIEILESKGGCPSVVIDDIEGRKMSYSVKENLEKVTLREHTFQTVFEVIKICKDEYTDWRTRIPMFIVAVLAHDIGKIQDYRTGQYNTHEHPYISEMVFSEIIASLESENKLIPPWVESVKVMIKEHHLFGKETQDLNVLKRADRNARAVELIRMNKEASISDINQWFNLNEFVKLLSDVINVSQTNKWEALTNKGIVFVRPSFAYDLLLKMKENNKIVDPLFIYPSQESILLVLAKILRKNELLVTHLVKEDHFGRKCRVVTPNVKNLNRQSAQILIPISLKKICEITGISMAQYENRKKGTLEILEIEIL